MPPSMGLLSFCGIRAGCPEPEPVSIPHQRRFYDGLKTIVGLGSRKGWAQYGSSDSGARLEDTFRPTMKKKEDK